MPSLAATKVVLNAVYRFGLLKGLGLIARLKTNAITRLKVPGVQQPLFLRRDTTDINTFIQVFITDQYNIELKDTPKIIVDAGANIGLSAVYFAERYKGARIIAVEPSPENFEVLLKNTSSYPNITCINKAIWNRKTHIEVKDSGFGNWAFIVEECSVNTKGAMEAVSIGDLMKEFDLDRIDLLKMDIEGSEKEVFEINYEQWLPKTKYLYVEVHDWLRKGASCSVFRTLSDHHFALSISDENLVLTNEAF